MTNKSSAELQQAFHYLFAEELVELKRILAELPKNPVIINIGAGAGTSGMAFLERSDSKVYTIDVQRESSPFGCLEAELTAAKAAGISDRLTQIHGDSKTVELPVTEADVVFIDGDHSYEGCKGDIERYWPMVKIGGYMLIHDFEKGKVYAEYDGNPPKDAPHPMEYATVDSAVYDFEKTDKQHQRSRVFTIAVIKKLPPKPVSKKQATTRRKTRRKATKDVVSSINKATE